MAFDPITHNKRAWNKESSDQSEWCTPVPHEVIEAARHGEWSIVLTPTKPVPRAWFPPLEGCRVLGLAAGGGQQCPTLAAAGAEVTVYDLSEVQLEQDRNVAERDGLELKAVVGDMADLSVFDDASFDLIVHPCSNCFAPDLTPVWVEAYRVLAPGGALLTGFMNPVYWVFDRDLDHEGILEARYRLPFSDVRSLSEERRQKKIDECMPFEFGHTLEAQIGGQLAAGFVLTGFYEDYWTDEATQLNRFMPIAIATRAVKLEGSGSPPA